MARVTVADVRLILNTTLTDLEIEAFIQLQNSNCTYSEDILTQIELYLSAHYCTLSDRELKSEKLGDATDVYAGVYGMGYESSRYGQMAITLDTCGILKTSSNPPAIFEVIKNP
jgi:hypothetical protein